MITTILRADRYHGYGFCVEGEAPCIINVLSGSIAYANGIRTGDVLIALNNVNVQYASHLKIASLFAKAVRRPEAIVTFCHISTESSRSLTYFKKKVTSMQHESERFSGFSLSASLKSNALLSLKPNNQYKRSSITNNSQNSQRRRSMFGDVPKRLSFQFSDDYLEMHPSTAKSVSNYNDSAVIKGIRSVDENAVKNLWPGAWSNVAPQRTTAGHKPVSLNLTTTSATAIGKPTIPLDNHIQKKFSTKHQKRKKIAKLSRRLLQRCLSEENKKQEKENRRWLIFTGPEKQAKEEHKKERYSTRRILDSIDFDRDKNKKLRSQSFSPIPHQQTKRSSSASSSSTTMQAGGTSACGSGGGASTSSYDNIDLEQVLKSETARAPFHQFLQNQFCAENINFYLAVEEYRKVPDEERVEFGRQIYERHFAANCIEPINIDNSTANTIREGYKNNRFSIDLYDIVQYQILHLLKYDCWPRFLRAGGQSAEELGGGADSAAGVNAFSCTTSTGIGSGGKRTSSDGRSRPQLKQQLQQRQSRRRSLFRFLRDHLNTTAHENMPGNIAGNSGLIASTSIEFSKCPALMTTVDNFGTLNHYSSERKIKNTSMKFLITSASSSCLLSSKHSKHENYRNNFPLRHISGNSYLSNEDSNITNINTENKNDLLNTNKSFSDVIDHKKCNDSLQTDEKYCITCREASKNDSVFSDSGCSSNDADGKSPISYSDYSGCNCCQKGSASASIQRSVTAGNELTKGVPNDNDQMKHHTPIRYLMTNFDYNITQPTFNICTDASDCGDGTIVSSSHISLSTAASEHEDNTCYDCKLKLGMRRHDSQPSTNMYFFSTPSSPITSPQKILPNIENNRQRRRGSSGFCWPLLSPNASRTSYSMSNSKQTIVGKEFATKEMKIRSSVIALGRRLSAGFVRKIGAFDHESHKQNDSLLIQSKSFHKSLPRRSISCSPQNARTSSPQNADELIKTRFAGIQMFDMGGTHTHYRHAAVREPPVDFPVKTCTLLSAECASSTEISLTNQLQSVKQWAAQMAESCGLDKNCSEVVDAQTGATIDPARQAVDALNNRTVRLMAVVRFPVIFLAPTSHNASSSSSNSAKSPLPAKVVILRARSTLTVNKVLTPMMLKYNVDPSEAVACFAGTVDVVERQMPIGAFCPRALTVMTHSQYVERKALAKRDYQKELNIVPVSLCMVGINTATGTCASTATASILSGTTGITASLSIAGPSGADANILASGENAATMLAFHQHGDVGFFEVPLEVDISKGLKHNATRSHSSNPKEFFKFARKPSQAKSARGPGFGSGITSAFGSGDHHEHSISLASGGDFSARQQQSQYAAKLGSFADRRKSLGATTMISASSATSSSTQMTIGGSNSASNSYKMARSTPQVEKSDIPYCGDEAPSSNAVTASTSTEITNPVYIANVADDLAIRSLQAATTDAAHNTDASARGGATQSRFLHHHAYCYEMPDFLKTNTLKTTPTANVQKSSTTVTTSGTNCSTIRLPALYSSRVLSDESAIPPTADVIERGLEWQQADYV